jgi:hypothetical protein
MNPTRTRIDATRWHWQHGPIDLILSADGEPAALQAAYEARCKAAWRAACGLCAIRIARALSRRWQPLQAASRTN